MTLNFFSCASLPFVYLLGKCLFKSFAHFFKIELFVFDLWLNTLFTMHELQPFLSHPVGFPFISLMRTFFEASEFPHFDQVKCISFFLPVLSVSWLRHLFQTLAVSHCTSLVTFNNYKWIGLAHRTVSVVFEKVRNTV